MFKEFEEYIAEYEKSTLEAYRNAAKARRDWANDYKNKSKDLFHMPFYTQNWVQHNLAMVHEDAKIIELKLWDKNYVAILDKRVLDGKEYPEVVAIQEVKEDGKYRWVDSRTEEKIIDINNLNGWKMFLADRGVNEADVKYVYGRDDAWMVERAHKDAEQHRKWIENKVEKMLGKVEEVAKVPGDGWYLHGSNGKVGHMWFVEAGGYNIQRLHYRCLLKEVRNK